MTREDFSFESAQLRALRDFSKTVVVPAVILAFLVRLTKVQLGYYTIPFYGLGIFVSSYLQELCRGFWLERDAKRLAGSSGVPIGSIPVVKGKLPGNIDIIIRAFANQRGGYVHDTILEWFEEYQSTIVNLRLFGVDKFITMDAEHIKFMLVTDHTKFWRGDTQKEILETFLGSGILNRDDEMWKAHRTAARPFFANDRTSDLGLFDKYINKTLNHISNLEPDQPIDFEDLASRFTIDTASEFLFGHNLDTLAYRDDGFDGFMDAFTKIQKVSLQRSIMGGLWPLFEVFGDKSKKHGDVIKAWITPLVERALEHKRRMFEKGQSVETDQSTFLEYLADQFDDVTVIRDQLINILLAARDTTTALLTYTVYMFTQHPEILARVRGEVIDALGPDGTPTLEDIRKLKYLRAVLYETLRLFTPLHGSIRQSRDQGVLLPPSDATFNRGPMYLPPNSPVYTLPMLLQRNEALWGPDAHVYDPDRWLDERLQRVVDNPAIFIPFGAGPRNCVGQNYALNKSSLFMIRLLQRFENLTLAEDKQLPPPWKANPAPTDPSKRGMFGPGWPGSKRKPLEKIWPGNHIVLYVKGGLWIRAKKAE